MSHEFSARAGEPGPQLDRPDAPALAMDAGQTRIKCRVVGGRPFAGTWAGVLTSRPVLPQLAETVVAASAACGHRFGAVAVGTTGLAASEVDPGALLALCAEAGVGRVLLAHDSITSYLGALGAANGVVVAAGTGVVTLGVGRDGTARVDGWGHVMGDAGSGYWLGRAALEAVMRAHDGRGPATALTEVVRARFPDLEQAYMEVQADPDHVRVVAAFALAASRLAATDEVAAGLCRRAGAELAVSAATAARRCDLGDAPTICLIGNLAASDAVSAAFDAGLADALPRHRRVPPAGDGLAGAAALLTLPPGHALAGMVAVASR